VTTTSRVRATDAAPPPPVPSPAPAVPPADDGPAAGTAAAELVRFQVAGTDVDEAVAVFEAGYGADLAVTPGEGDLSWAHTALGDATMTLRTTRFTAAVRGTADAEGDHVVAWTRRGVGTVDRGRSDVPVTARQPWLFPSERRFGYELSDVEMSLVHLDRRFVQSLADELAVGPAGSLRLDHTVRPSPAALADWRATVAEVATTLHAVATPSPLLRLELARLAGIALLTTFAEGSEPAGGALAHRAVRTAAEFLREHAHLPVGTDDAAAAAGLSVRGLQQAFRRTLGVTPTQYLRGVRLERVREELAAAAPGDALVSDVARRWGFAHLGRFAGTYQQRWGEHPTDTLRRPGPPQG